MGLISSLVSRAAFWSFRLAIEIEAFSLSVRYRLLKRRERVRWHSEGKKISGRVAVVAVYPRPSNGYWISLERVLVALDRTHDVVLVCSNRALTPSEVGRLAGPERILIERGNNRGRDFGAYKVVITEILRKSVPDSITRITLVNDSLYWFGDPLEIIDRISSQPWGCMFLNLRGVGGRGDVHAHSFFLSFGVDIVRSQHFSTYWESFLPSRFKWAAIHRGEIALTTRLTQAGFSPSPLVTPSFVRTFLARWGDSSVELSSPPRMQIRPQLSGVAKPANRKAHNLYSIDEVARSSFFDAPHSIGLTLTTLAGFPLKKDIYKFANPQDISAALEAADPQNALEFEADLIADMAAFWRAGFKAQLLRNLGEG